MMLKVSSLRCPVVELGLYEAFSGAYGHVTGPLWRAGVGQFDAQVLFGGEFRSAQLPSSGMSAGANSAQQFGSGG